MEQLWGGLTAIPFGRILLNTFFIAGMGALIAVTVSVLSAFAFARLQFKGRNQLFAVFIATLMLPIEVLVIPLFIGANEFGAVNTYSMIILPFAFGAFGTFLLRQFLLSLPPDYEEAARIDGASQIQLLWHVIVPLLRGPIAIVAAFAFIDYWNAFLWPLIIITDPAKAPLQLGLSMFSGERGTDWGPLMAACSATEWYTHNPYSEWYYNTIRLEGSAAWKHQQEVYGGRPYDDFIDEWKAENFDASALVGELAAAGADYLVLTTKHHDGVCLWDAPGTDRNTVARGPKKDLVGAYSDACREHGVRFGAYYSGGLDWHERPFAPIGEADIWSWDGLRPLDEEYAAYAADHVRDLVQRYQPDVLWDDIEWPDAGKNFGPHGIGSVFEEFYAANPDGVVNDRWNVPHADYVTSEYQYMLDNEDARMWENCRGVGLSFAYNQEEDLSHALAGPLAIRHLVDVVTRGGRLLFGVGPMADGRLPEWQSEVVASVGRWVRPAGQLLQVAPTDRTLDLGEDVWVRLGAAEDGSTLAFIDADTPVEVAGELLTPEWGLLVDGVLTLAPDRPGAAVVRLA